MPSIVCLIPARAGSKRVANKNVRALAGHPVIAYTIRAAIDSEIFDRVIVSTDDEQYAEISRHYGAEVPCLRPKEFATSTSPDVEWISHMLDQVEGEDNRYDCFSILRPTSPMRTPETIKRAWDAFLAETGVDSLRAVERVSQHPGKMWIVRGNRMLPLLPLSPAQQPWHSTQMAALPEVYVQNASLEIAWTRVIRGGGNIAGHVVMPFITTGIEGFDINNEYDWQVLQVMLRNGEASLPDISV